MKMHLSERLGQYTMGMAYKRTSQAIQYPTGKVERSLYTCKLQIIVALVDYNVLYNTRTFKTNTIML